MCRTETVQDRRGHQQIDRQQQKRFLFACDLFKAQIIDQRSQEERKKHAVSDRDMQKLERHEMQSDRKQMRNRFGM